MAVELCAGAGDSPQPQSSSSSSSSRGISPRISFSHDLSKYDVVPIEPHLPLNPCSLFDSANFNFYSPALPSHSSPADELFSNGVLLPLQDSLHLPKPPPRPPPSNNNNNNNNNNLPKPLASSTSSFWKFKRSRSFNCGSIYRGTLCPLLLSRSKSTGSNNSSTSKKEDHNRLKHKTVSSSPNSYSGYQHRPPLRSNNNTPVVLNVSSGNLFGFGSIFTSFSKAAPPPHNHNKKKLII